ncbi:MAG: cytochrome C [Gammaproteobacteria bacterium]|jgi:thiosulfate dehydrogenase
MNITLRQAILAGVATFAVVFTVIAVTAVQARPVRTEVQAAQERAWLLDAVAKGDALWHDASLGTNGLACGNCHPDGSASNPHTFPKWQQNLGKVGTLREMINWCITVPLQGKPLALDSEEMISMEAYATYTHRGVKLEPAKYEQHGAVPVENGPGYPSQ